MKERIRQLMESQHMNQQSFANYVGIATATLSSILIGRTKPTLNTVESIMGKMPDVNLDWLLFGKGEMFASSDSASSVSSQSSLMSGDLFGGDNAMSDDGAADPVKNATPYYNENNQTGNQAYSIDSNGQRSAKPGVRGQRMLQSPVGFEMKNIDKAQRKITEIRVFFDDQTWESFVPKK